MIGTVVLHNGTKALVTSVKSGLYGDILHGFTQDTGDKWQAAIAKVERTNDQPSLPALTAKHHAEEIKARAKQRAKAKRKSAA